MSKPNRDFRLDKENIFMDSDYFFEGFLSRENCILVKLAKRESAARIAVNANVCEEKPGEKA
jgi:hypothetical protein